MGKVCIHTKFDIGLVEKLAEILLKASFLRESWKLELQ